MDHNNILGTVLAGGKSQRFGEDKSQVKLAGKLLIDHMLTEIIDEFKELLIVSNNKISFNNSEKISIIEDYEKGLGPLGGVLSAMKWIKENQKDYKWIATFPVDTPFFKRQILKDFIHRDNWWVKICGSERISLAGPPFYDAVPYAQELVETAPDRVLWGTDWPHPNIKTFMPNDGDLLDLVPLLARDPSLQKKILVDNPARLYGFHSK